MIVRGELVDQCVCVWDRYRAVRSGRIRPVARIWQRQCMAADRFEQIEPPAKLLIKLWRHRLPIARRAPYSAQRAACNARHTKLEQFANLVYNLEPLLN